MELERVLECMNKDIHHSWVHIWIVQESQIDVQGNFEGIVFNGYLKKVNELLVGDLTQV
jgi:hypothetical protein